MPWAQRLGTVQSTVECTADYQSSNRCVDDRACSKAPGSVPLTVLNVSLDVRLGDPVKPLGLAFWRRRPFGRVSAQMRKPE